MVRVRALDPTEHQIQAAFIQLVKRHKNRYPALNISFAIVNAQKMMSKANKPQFLYRYMLAEGFQPGVPDWVLPWPACGYHGLWIEFKASKGSLRPDQRRFHSWLRLSGHLVEVFRDAELAFDLVRRYLNGQIKRPAEAGPQVTSV